MSWFDSVRGALGGGGGASSGAGMTPAQAATWAQFHHQPGGGGLFGGLVSGLASGPRQVAGAMGATPMAAGQAMAPTLGNLGSGGGVPFGPAAPWSQAGRPLTGGPSGWTAPAHGAPILTPQQSAEDYAAAPSWAQGTNYRPPAAAGQSGYALMRAPNGQTRHVPPHEIDHYQRLGATRIG